MSIYEPSLDPSSPSYAPFAFLDKHPPEAVRIQRAEDAAKAEAIRTAEGNRLVARLREQDRVSTGKSTFVNDVIAHEKFDGEFTPEPLTSDSPVSWKRHHAEHEEIT